MEEVTKKVAPGKINHKNTKKSCQIVLSSAEFQYCSLLICQAFQDRTVDEKCLIFATQCFLTTSKGPMKFFNTAHV